MKMFIARATALAWLFFAAIAPASASQITCIMPNTGTVPGLTLVNDINACTASLLSLYSGGSSPSSPTTGMFWYDTGTNYVRQFDGTSWQPIWYVDATNHLTTLPISGGSVSASLVAAATTDIGSVPQAFVTLTGNTAITSFGSSAIVGSIHVIKFSGTPVVTYNVTSLIIPGGTNVAANVGDIAFAIYLGSGNWQILFYQNAAGTALVNTAIPLGTILYGVYGTIPPKTVLAFGQALARSSYPAFLSAVTRAQNMTRTSGNATLASVTDTSGFGVGMPVEGGGITAGCTIASLIANTSITLNSTSCVTASGVASITVFLTGYGTSGSGSTVGVADCRGRVIAGRDDLGTAAANRLTATTVSSGTSDLGFGGLQTYTMLTTNLPPYTPSGGVAVSISSNLNGAFLVVTAGGSNTPNGGPNQTISGYLTGSISGSGTFTGSAQGGTSAPFSIIQPTLVADCVQAVLP
jgi:hypothetical protein